MSSGTDKIVESIKSEAQEKADKIIQEAEAKVAAIGVGASIGFAGLGSGMGQGIVASSAVGAIVEDNDMFARGIIFSALPETQAIYGFLIAILLMVFGGILG